MPLKKISIEQVIEEVNSENMKIVSRCDDPNFINVVCLECGTHQVKRLNTLKKSTYSRCQVCLDTRTKREANLVDLEVVGKSTKTNRNAIDYRQYKLQCGHIKEFSLSHVIAMHDHPKCDQCVVEDIQYVVETHHDLIFIEKKIPQRATVKCKQCGCVFHPQVSNLKYGRGVKCPDCGDSFASKPAELYLFKISVGDFSWLKMGYSINPYLRHLGYGLSEDAKCEFLGSLSFQKGSEARKVEQKLFDKFARYRISPSLMRAFMTSGFTECLFIDSEQSLKEALTNLGFKFKLQKDKTIKEAQ